MTPATCRKLLVNGHHTEPRRDQSRMLRRVTQLALSACLVAMASAVSAQSLPAPKSGASEVAVTQSQRAERFPNETPAPITTTLGSPGQRPTLVFDFDSDGTPDTVRREMRLDPGELLFSRFVVVSGATGLDLDAFPAPEPNDLFGWIVATVGDLDADTVPDLAVAAPRAHTGIPSDGVRGRVYILSGATHDTLLTIDGDWWGFSGLGLVVVDDQDADGVLDLLIAGMQRVVEVDPGNPGAPDGDNPVFEDPPTEGPVAYFHSTWSLHSLGAGEVIEAGEGAPPVRFIRPGESMQQLWLSGPIPGPRLWLEGASGDLNGDGIVDMQDLLRLIDALGDPNRADPLDHTFKVGDLNGDGAVDTTDLTTLLTQYGQTATEIARARRDSLRPSTTAPQRDCTDELGFGGGGGCTMNCPDCEFDIPTPDPPGGGSCPTCCPGPGCPNCPDCTGCDDCPPPPPDCTTQCECFPDAPVECEVDFIVPEGSQSPIDDALLILPGDSERIRIEYRAPCNTDTFLTVSNIEIAGILVEDEIHSWIELERSPASVEIIGLSGGLAYLQLHTGSSDGPICDRIKVRIGGSIRIQYDRAPSFRPYLDDAPPSTPARNHRGGDPEPTAFDPGLGNRQGIQPGLAPIILDQTSPSVATFKIRIEDADGNSKKDKEVRILFRDGKVLEIPIESTSTTNEEGEITFRLSSNIDGKRPQEWGVERDNAAVLIGRTARQYVDNHISSAEINDARQFTRCGTHTFGGHYLQYESSFVDAVGDKHILMASLDVPMINQLQEAICVQAFERQVYTPLIEFAGQPISILDPLSGQLIPVEGGIPADSRILNLDSFMFELALGQVMQQRHEQNPDQQGVDFQIDIRPPIAEDPPPGWEGKLVTVGAIAAELAIAMVPGGDLLDIFLEFLWKPFFKNERPDTVVGAIALIGFALDAGWLTGPLGAAANFGAGALKTVFKFIPNDLAMAMLRAGDTIIDTVSMTVDLINRIPTPPGTAGLTASIHQVQNFSNMCIKAMNSGLQLTGNHISAAFLFFSRRFRGHFSQEALEGMGYLQKLGRHQVAERLSDEFAEEVVDATLGLAPKMAIADGAVSDDAVRGVAVAIQEVGHTNAGIVRDIFDSTNYASSPTRQDLAFRGVSELREVEGLGEMVIFLRRNRNSVGGFGTDGSIYECTAAARVARGELPEVGALTQVAADGEEATRKIDAFTNTHALQMKHKTADTAFLPTDIRSTPEACEVYFSEMASQAVNQGVTPMLITNRPIGTSLAQILALHGIEWRMLPGGL